MDNDNDSDEQVNPNLDNDIDSYEQVNAINIHPAAPRTTYRP